MENFKRQPYQWKVRPDQPRLCPTIGHRRDAIETIARSRIATEVSDEARHGQIKRVLNAPKRTKFVLIINLNNVLILKINSGLHYNARRFTNAFVGEFGASAACA